MTDSVFTKIIKGELSAHKVYEDDQVIAIIPLRPIALGHVLVIPKVQIDEFIDLDSDSYQALMKVVQRIAKHMKKVLNPKRVGLQVVGLDVPHVHVHVIAFDTHEEFCEVADESVAPNMEYNQELANRLSLL